MFTLFSKIITIVITSIGALFIWFLPPVSQNPSPLPGFIAKPSPILPSVALKPSKTPLATPKPLKATPGPVLATPTPVYTYFPVSPTWTPIPSSSPTSTPQIIYIYLPAPTPEPVGAITPSPTPPVSPLKILCRNDIVDGIYEIRYGLTQSFSLAKDPIGPFNREDYTWFTPWANPSEANGILFTTKFNYYGDHTVIIRDSWGQQDKCVVRVLEN